MGPHLINTPPFSRSCRISTYIYHDHINLVSVGRFMRATLPPRNSLRDVMNRSGVQVGTIPRSHREETKGTARLALHDRLAAGTLRRGVSFTMEAGNQTPLLDRTAGD